MIWHMAMKSILKESVLKIILVGCALSYYASLKVNFIFVDNGETFKSKIQDRVS